MKNYWNMVGKPITGKSFGGCVRYLVNRPEATILDADGVATISARSITEDFNMQRKMNPWLGKAVGHTILSWSGNDSPKLDDATMVGVAQKYMEKMGIRDTQYLIVRHTDQQHPHVHLVFNRVDNYGKTITDRNDYRRNVKVCRELSEAYSFHIPENKEQVNRLRLKGVDKVKYAIHDAIKEVLITSVGWKDLEEKLNQKGITIHFKYRGDTEEVQGISFKMGGIRFKGSAIDRAFSFANLDKKLCANSKISVSEADMSTGYKGIQHHLQSVQKPLSDNTEAVPGELVEGAGKMLEILTRDEHLYAEYDPFERDLKRKRKKKRKGISL